MAKKDPQRTERTRRNIMDAYWSLYVAKPGAVVTVSAIVAVAGIHRSTFYVYFHDGADVLDAIECELVELIGEEATKTLVDPNGTDPAGIMSRVYVAHASKLAVLLGDGGDPAFARRVKDAVIPQTARTLGIDFDDIRNCYVLEFLASGILATISLWYAHGCDLTYDELSGAIGPIVEDGLKGYAQVR